MRLAWEVLQAAGLPLSGSRERPVRDPGVLAAAALDAMADASASPREREALGAWLGAWRSHWPSSFAAAFGPDDQAVSDAVSALCPDPNRYLKLRRIALAHLAEIL